MGFADWISIINMTAAVATALGVAVAATGLWLSREQTKTQFEDNVTNEYRQLLKEIPAKALLENDEPLDLSDSLLDAIYNYIDFTNEQVFLRQKNRIRKTTWISWVEGIKSNLEKSTIKMGWNKIKDKAPGSFSELRTLENFEFNVDPRSREFRDKLDHS